MGSFNAQQTPKEASKIGVNVKHQVSKGTRGISPLVKTNGIHGVQQPSPMAKMSTPLNGTGSTKAGSKLMIGKHQLSSGKPSYEPLMAQ